MLLSSLSICRLIRTIKPSFGVWVDKSKAKTPNNTRYCAFRYFDENEANEVANGMKSLIETGGFENKVKVTQRFDYRCQCPVYYVRITAVKL